MKFDGRVALVTGAGRGLGRGIALALAREGADLAIVDVYLADGTAKEVEKIGRRELTIEADVSKNNEVEHAVEETLKNLGKIDILVNNAGIARIASVIDMKEEDWDATFGVNVKGVFLFCKAVAKHMIRQGSGRIINVASDAGKTGEPFLAAYSASKFAVIGFTQAFALEMAPYNINVNAVCPSFVDTKMNDYIIEQMSKLESKSPDQVRNEMKSNIPLGRVAVPDDIAKVVMFLASDESSFITGQAINVTGGGMRKFCVGG